MVTSPPPATGEIALIVEVPIADPIVGAIREAHDPAAALGVPAHITIGYPFAPPDAFAATRPELVEILATVEPIRFELGGLDQFPGCIWLRPTPDDALRALIDRIWSAFPAYPPYGGAHPDPQPHVTVATPSLDEQPPLYERLVASLAPSLPLSVVADALSVFERGEGGTFSRLERLPFGG